MFTTYTLWVSNNLLFSAAIQFAILGTLGEVISHFIKTKRYTLPCTVLQLCGKILAWALLGIVIKYGFAGMKGFTSALVGHHMLPQFFAQGIGWAFAVSIFTNTFFGPQMMFFHRIEDNLILRQWNFAGISKALKTLYWFWIPAHTLTFSLPKDYQIGLAALWSIVLGLILGLATKTNSQKHSSPQH